MKNLLDKVGIDRIAVVLVSIFLISIYIPGWMKRIENIAGDSIVRTFSDRKKVGSHLVFANTSQNDLEIAQKLYGIGWPWPRAIYSRLIRFMNRAGARLIVFDSTFTESSNYSNLLTKFWPVFNQMENLLLKDLKLSKTNDINLIMKKAGNIIVDQLGLNDDENFAKAMMEEKNVIIGNFFDLSDEKLNKQIDKKILSLSEKTDKKLKTIISDVIKKRITQLDNSVAKGNLSQASKKKVLQNIQIWKDKLKKIPTASKEEVLVEIRNIIYNRYKKKYQNRNNKSVQKFAIPVQVMEKNNVFPVYYKTVPPIKLFNDVVAHLGSVEGPIDSSDNTTRRVLLLVKYFDKYYPTLSFATVYHSLKPKKIEIWHDYIQLDKITIPLTHSGHMRLNYHGDISVYKSFYHMDMLLLEDHIQAIYDAYSKSGKTDIKKTKLYEHTDYIKKVSDAIKLTHPKLAEQTSRLIHKMPVQDLKGKIVLMGGTAPGMLDLRPTPFSTTEPGVHIHATAIDNILSNDILVEFRGNIYLIISIFALALFTYLLIHKRSIIASIILTFSLLIIVIVFSILSYKYFNYLIDTVTPVLSIVFTVIVITGINYFKESKQKKYIQGAFGQYLSPKVIDIIIDDPDKLNLGGVRKEISAFFSDVQGFSTFSESLSPEDLVQLLNEYLTAMCDIISKYDGVVDKFEGDAIIAFWGAPLDQPDHARLSCYTSIEMQETLIDMRKAWRDQGRNELLVRIGVNSGPAVVGNLGSSQRMDYTMMGDTVNLAARLEGANKFYTTYSMISDATYQMAKDFVDVRELDTIQVVGKNEPVTVYELLAKKDQTKGPLAEATELYLKALKLYRQLKFAEALSVFQSALKVIPDDGPSKTYVERCQTFIDNPPPDNWDGVYRLTSKG